MLGKASCNTIAQYLSKLYQYYGHHFENEHRFELESIKNEFNDLENLLKHVLHIELLKNMRHIHYFTF